MIFQEGHSSLVRLSDCLKMNVGNALETAEESISMHRKHADALKEIRRLAKEHLNRLDTGQVSDSSQEAMEAASARVPFDEARAAISLQGRLHSETLSVILTSCFTLESYINSLGFFLLRERDIIGLFRNSSTTAAEAFLEAIDRMNTLTKWQTIARLKSDSGFDAAASPFQDVKTLFRFRDDHVHDKVVDWGSERDKKRYNNKLPDSFGQFLNLSHAVFACDTYWGMILKIHDLVGVPLTEFHRHYNLRPWFDDEFERNARQTADEYDRTTKC
jgi:hypothetical protein